MIARVHLLDQQLWAAVFAVIFGLIFAALFCVPGAFIANWLQPSLARWRESNRERRAEPWSADCLLGQTLPERHNPFRHGDCSCGSVARLPDLGGAIRRRQHRG